MVATSIGLSPYTVRTGRFARNFTSSAASLEDMEISFGLNSSTCFTISSTLPPAARATTTNWSGMLPDHLQGVGSDGTGGTQDRQSLFHHISLSLDQLDRVQNEKNEQEAVKAIQDPPMTGEKGTGILHTRCPFHRRFDQVSQWTDDADHLTQFPERWRDSPIPETKDR